MDTTKKIVICGGGVAGPTCAYWLNRYGYSSVIVERATALRDGGQNVDIKGAGQRVINMMDLSEEIEAKNTGERGQRYLDASGAVIADLPKGAFGTLTNDFEILRGDFAQVLFEATQDVCEYRFGRHVTGLEEKSDCVAVTFDNGEIEDFEMLICAEGANSTTRGMTLAAQTHFRYLGACMAFFKIPRRPEDDKWAWTVNGVGGTFLTLRPGNDTETTVLVTFLRKEQRPGQDSPAEQRKMLDQALAGRGTLAERVRADLEAVEDLYFGPMSQVQASSWSSGRVVLLGDAAYSPTPFTGEGTALALVGAYVLAGEIKRHPDHRQAFAAYERLVRPYVHNSQQLLSPGRIRLMHPKSRWGIGMTHLVQRCLASAPVQRRFRPTETKRAQAVADDFTFADYS